MLSGAGTHVTAQSKNPGAASSTLPLKAFAQVCLVEFLASAWLQSGTFVWSFYFTSLLASLIAAQDDRVREHRRTRAAPHRGNPEDQRSRFLASLGMARRCIWIFETAHKRQGVSGPS